MQRGNVQNLAAYRLIFTQILSLYHLDGTVRETDSNGRHVSLQPAVWQH